MSGICRVGFFFKKKNIFLSFSQFSVQSVKGVKVVKVDKMEKAVKPDTSVANESGMLCF